MTQGLVGNRIVITGGGSGIGLATARKCSGAGAIVSLIGRRLAPLRQAAQETGGYAIAADLRIEAEARRAINQAAEQMGGLDGVINCVGRFDVAAIDEIDLERWDESIRTNLTSHYLVCRAAIPHLRRSSKAAIVNVAALAAILPGVSSAAYAAAKAGLVQFSRIMAAQLAPQIRVNCVCPGAVETETLMRDFMATLSKSEQASFIGRYACNRLATPDEIAGLLVFLIGPEASYITGSNYVADGGRAYY